MQVAEPNIFPDLPKSGSVETSQAVVVLVGITKLPVEMVRFFLSCVAGALAVCCVS